MKHLKYLLLLAALLAVPAVQSHAQVSIGVQIGPTYGFYHDPPVCAYGYYPDYPFACAPYGYWGPEWFVGDVFIGAGPWDHFYYSHPEFYRGGRWVHRDFDDHERFERFHDRGRVYVEPRRDFRDNDHGFRDRDDRGFRDRDQGWHRDDNGFRGRAEFHGDMRGSGAMAHAEVRGGGGSGRGDFHGGRGGRR